MESDHTMHATGPNKISVTVTRKVEGDLVSSQWSIQRWFRYEHEAIQLLVQLVTNLAALVNSEGQRTIGRETAADRERDEIEAMRPPTRQ